MWDFHVGQRVVCVDAESHGRYTPWNFKLTQLGLELKRIYKIRKVGEYRGQLSVWLEEITRTNHPSFGEPGFSPKRFRPLVKRKTDISIFTNMLLPKSNVLDKKKVLEDA